MFKKSKSFDLFLGALRSSNTFGENDALLKDKNCPVGDPHDESLASDLDMHSLILDSSHDSVYHPGEETLNADKIIEEIEHMMMDKGVGGGDYDNDDMVALNASSLLNSALDSWAKYRDLFSDEESEDSEFRSLTVMMSSPIAKSDGGKNQGKLKTSHTANSLESSQASTSEISTTSQNSFVERIQELSIVKLNELLMDMEGIIQMKSEILIQQLAQREDAENEKELKNNFISSLLEVQNKRRLLVSSEGRKKLQQNNNKLLMRRRSDVGSTSKLTSSILSSRFVPNLNTLKESFGLGSNSGLNSASNCIFLTTVIPYNAHDPNFLDNSTLEMLIKRKFYLFYPLILN